MGNLFRRLVYLWRRGKEDAALREELETHRRLRQAQLEAQGLPSDQAAQASRKALGNVFLAREDARGVWIASWLEGLHQDLRNGVRILMKHPGVTATAVLSLALGIGANTAVFSVVNRMMIEPLPYREPERLVMISAVPEARPDEHNGATIPEYIAWQSHARAFEGMATAFQQPLTLGAEGDATFAETVLVEKVRSSLFDVVGVRPAIGRPFRADEEHVDAPAPVVLLSDGFWARRYGRNPDVVNRVITLNGVRTTIVGVMPPEFVLLGQGSSDLFAPLSFNSPQLRGTARVFPIVARLKPGLTLAQAQDDMDAVMRRTVDDLPEQSRGWTARVRPLHEAFAGNFRAPLVLLQSVVGFVLLIACGNVAGLLMARSAARQTEIAVRAAIGAGQGRIVRQLLTESVVLALAGGLAGLAVGWLFLRLLVTMSAAVLPAVPEVGIDLRVLIFTLGVAVLTGMAFGLFPALEASRPDLVRSLRPSARGAVTVARQRLRRGVVIAQIAIAFMLLIGAGLTLRSLLRLETRDLGGDPAGVLGVNVPLPGFRQVGSYEGYPLVEAPGNVSQRIDQVLERIRALSGVQAVAGASLPPFMTSGPVVGFDVEGRPAAVGGAGETLGAAYQLVTPGFFSIMRVPMEHGREFDDRDVPGGPWGVIINAAMAQRFWPNESPIGQRVVLDLTPDERPREVIGIVRDYRSSPYELAAAPAMFVHYDQQPLHARSPVGLLMRNRMTFVIRTAGDPAALAGQVRDAVAELDRNRPIADARPVEEDVAAVIAPSRYVAVVLGLFAGIALLLAAVGAYGVVSHGIGQRTREIGVRMALGAQRRDVLRLVLTDVLMLASIGVGVGLAGTVALTRLMPSVVAGMVWDVAPMDTATYLAVSMLMALVALLAGWIPTQRALRVAPTVALRSE